MAEVRVHYDGWVALPAMVRRQLGIGAGDALEVVLTGKGLLLRPLSEAVKAEPEPPARAAEERMEPEQAANADEPPPAVAEADPASAAARRTARKSRSSATLPSDRKSRGKRRQAGKE